MAVLCATPYVVVRPRSRQLEGNGEWMLCWSGFVARFQSHRSGSVDSRPIGSAVHVATIPTPVLLVDCCGKLLGYNTIFRRK